MAVRMSQRDFDRMNKKIQDLQHMVDLANNVIEEKEDEITTLRDQRDGLLAQNSHLRQDGESLFSMNTNLRNRRIQRNADRSSNPSALKMRNKHYYAAKADRDETQIRILQQRVQELEGLSSSSSSSQVSLLDSLKAMNRRLVEENAHQAGVIAQLSEELTKSRQWCVEYSRRAEQLDTIASELNMKLRGQIERAEMAEAGITREKARIAILKRDMKKQRILFEQQIAGGEFRLAQERINNAAGGSSSSSSTGSSSSSSSTPMRL